MSLRGVLGRILIDDSSVGDYRRLIAAGYTFRSTADICNADGLRIVYGLQAQLLTIII
jgi:hypothetical protein